MKARPQALTVVFYLAFAVWFTAIRYGSPSFYSWLLAPVAQTILNVGMFGLFCLSVILAVTRGLGTHSIPWIDAAITGCALVGLDLFWRLYLSRLAWEAIKLTSMALDIATPLVACLGVAALTIELRRTSRFAIA